MTCQQSQLLMSARVDGELPPDQSVSLDAHLAECAACQDELVALLQDHSSLRTAFAERRLSAVAVAERAIAQIADPPTLALPPARSRTARRILTPLLAAAAGFALAILIFRPWHHPTPPVAQQPVPNAPAVDPVARLALATGQVDIRPPGAAEFFVCPTGGTIEPGTVVRTGPKVRCELRMTDGSDVRLNDSTQVTVHSARKLDLAGGQLFSAVAKVADTTGGRPAQFVVTATPADVSLVALGTEFDVSCTPAHKRATLTVVEGSVRVDGAGASPSDSVVKAGEAVTLAGGSMADRRQVRSLVAATAWVDELLVMKGRDNPELARRLDDLLAQLGHQKMQYLAAQDVRRLGDHCVVPLTRFIQSDASKTGADPQHRRREAARIVADVATTSSLPELINLLADGDGEVRFHAARALERLTGQNQGRRPEQWRDQAWMTCTPTVEAWHGWWAKNKSVFPGCDPDAVRPLKAIAAPENIEKKG
ncbi:MAG TPA: FecR domain-containing protein [Tepidisphaeraceae bacterium]|nr:FecR domain-containing protein [Tepidisphaeraceae bacterium]